MFLRFLLIISIIYLSFFLFIIGAFLSHMNLLVSLPYYQTVKNFILIYSIKYDTIQREEYTLSNVEKLIEKIKRQPNGIRPEEAEKILKAYIVDIINRLKL